MWKYIAMAKVPPNQHKAWTGKDVTQLKSEISHDTPTRLIALHTGRSEDAVRSKVQDLGLSLKPVNQSPYDRKPKKW